MSQKPAKQKNRDEDSEGSECTEPKLESVIKPGLNVLSRPKRSIHFRKLYIPPELLKPSADAVTSSSDEDFVPKKKKKKTSADQDDQPEPESERSGKEDDESGGESSNSDDDESFDDEGSDDETEEEDESDKSSSEQQEPKGGKEAPSGSIRMLLGDEDEDESDDEDFEVGESEMGDSENSDSEDSSQDDGDQGSLNGSDQEPEPDKPRAPKVKPEGEGRKVGRPRKQQQQQQTERQAKKPRKTKKKLAGNRGKQQQFDEETEQFLSHFKSPLIKGQLKKAAPKKEPTGKAASKMAPGASQNNAAFQGSHEAQLGFDRVNTGPHVKCSQVTMGDNGKHSYTYTSYKVNQNLKSAEQHSSEATAENAKNGGLPRDKAPLVKDTDSPWECVFCAGGDDQLGGLYGPYRVSLDYEVDMNNENQMLLDVFDNESNRQDFIEVWMHSSCATWSPSIIVKNNSAYGVAAAVKASRNVRCFGCQQTGANLRCKADRCKNAFHYRCALTEKCSFDLKSFDMLCTKCLPKDKDAIQLPSKRPPKLVKADSRVNLD